MLQAGLDVPVGKFAMNSPKERMHIQWVICSHLASIAIPTDHITTTTVKYVLILRGIELRIAQSRTPRVVGPWQGGPDAALSVWVTQEQEGLNSERLLRNLLLLCNPDIQSDVWATPPPRRQD